MSQLALVLLGDPSISRNGETITRFRSEKARALLFYLALEHERAHAREHLCGLFWGGLGESQARHNLSQALFYLQAALGKATISQVITATRATLQFHAGDTQIDAGAFLELLALCDAHPHRDIRACAACQTRLERAVTLYRGELLAHFSVDDCPEFEEWLVVRREQFQRRALDALRHITAYHQAQGVTHHEETMRYARRQIELEPWREEPYRVLMQTLAATNQVDAALAEFQNLTRVLNDELGLEPSPETVALFKHLRDVNQARQAGADGKTHLTLTTTLRTEAFVPALSNLPLSTTLLVGRAVELAELSERITDANCRLLTLVGQGGIGKTRLALETARENLSAFPGGTYFVDLTDVVSAGDIPGAIAEALQFPFHGEASPTRQILYHLSTLAQPVLLVLDNLEQIVNAASLIHEMVRRAPNVTLLATSRERLNLGEEWLFEVEGLETPTVLPTQPGPDWNASAAVQLVEQCAVRAHVKTEKWSAEDKRAAIRITQLVEGMPLAIELACGWLRTLTPVEIAGEIAQSLDALEGARRDMPRRHAGIRAVFDHSWRLLNANEQHVFAHLAVFHGGMTREAAAEIAGGSLPLLAALVDKSLVKRAGTGRFRMHELIRQYAAEKLVRWNTGARDKAELGHSRYFLQLVETLGPRLVRHGGGIALQELEREVDNVRQAWRAACIRHDLDALTSVLNSLALFYLTGALYQDGVNQIAFALEQLQVTPESRAKELPAPFLASRLLAEQARLETQLTRYDDAIRHARQAISLGEAAGDAPGVTAGLLYRGYAMRRQGEYVPARRVLEQAVEHARTAGLASLEWEARMYLGGTFWNESAYGPAREHWEAALAVCRRLGDLRGESLLLNNLAIIAHEQGMFQAAFDFWSESRRTSKLVGTDWLWGGILVNVGLLDIDRGNFDAAWTGLNQAHHFFRDIRTPWQENLARLGLGQLALAMGDYPLAREHLEIAAHGLEEVQAQTDHARGLALLALTYQYLNEPGLASGTAERGVSIAREIRDQFTLAKALLILGFIQASAERWDDANTAYREALAISTRLGLAYLQIEARAGILRGMLHTASPGAWSAQVEPIAQFLAAQPADGMDVPAQVYWACGQGLALSDKRRAGILWTSAHTFLLDRAGTIQAAAARRRFLEVPLHREILQAWEQTGIPRAKP